MPEPDIRKRTFEFSCACISLHKHLVRRGGPARALARQSLDAGTSVGANLEEAHAAASKIDFISKTTIALREAREAFYWLRLFDRCELGDARLVKPMCQEANEIVAILTTIVKNAKSNID